MIKRKPKKGDIYKDQNQNLIKITEIARNEQTETIYVIYKYLNKKPKDLLYYMPLTGFLILINKQQLIFNEPELSVENL